MEKEDHTPSNLGLIFTKPKPKLELVSIILNKKNYACNVFSKHVYLPY